MRYLLALVCAGVLTAGAAQATTPRNGLYGVVSRGPITPVCVAEQPCSAPAPGRILQFWNGGRMGGHVVTKSDGSYRIALPAATYTVRLASGRIPDPETTRVRALRFRH